ncbi:putative CxxC motif protein [Halorubrum virus Serpecor1]|uniref:Putative CxxC motif protein n=1 Tax=Halorubrum virus Serpecor1 TaxID=2721757 RepID=A0A6G9RWL1_9CAUD|nr:putative CxxC motif protein [Halorubrum virus Serpecor1]QIR31275.1 putative CxxC motif protein [Halorubrum virus Serpecor1]
MCEHKDRRWLVGRGKRAKWRCNDCHREIRGYYDHNEDRFIEFLGGTWP